ncbi:ureidoglycolate hydrolase [Geopyxis carbonaria]|nr:ureidoglycolate hydrolase [Geopyxis carbonaria]
MPLLTTLPAPPATTIPVHPLTSAAFAPFGDVLARPPPSSSSGITVNQGSATKHPLLSTLTSTYPPSPAPVAGLNLFVCRPRTLSAGGIFACTILERHPFTSQTFIPITLPGETRYVVIVAPTGEDGMPVLEGMRAFWGAQGTAVTYAKGTWHAPMVVLGEEEGVFVVVNAQNGVPGMDCEEVGIGGEGVGVRVGMGGGLWERGAKL